MSDTIFYILLGLGGLLSGELLHLYLYKKKKKDS